jgi:hypothetical protein
MFDCGGEKEVIHVFRVALSTVLFALKFLCYIIYVLLVIHRACSRVLPRWESS